MIYQQVVAEIRAAANACLGESGRFLHGRVIDASQQHHGPYPLIVLYPFQIRKALDPDVLDSSDLLLGFWQQDSAKSTPEERELLIAQMDYLSDLLINVLSANKHTRLTGVVKEPQYQFYQGTVSGFAVRLNYLNYKACVDYDYQPDDYNVDDYATN